jgi:hypothetical protein
MTFLSTILTIRIRGSQLNFRGKIKTEICWPHAQFVNIKNKQTGNNNE